METETSENEELVELDAIAREATGVAIKDEIKAVLRRDLGPVAERMHSYAAFAAIVNVANQEDADRASGVVAEIDRDLKLVKSNDVLTKITDGLFKLHRRATAFRALFTDPMERDKKAIRAPVLAWQEGERRKAKAEQARLQAAADERARKEREALLKKAAAVKTPEKQEAYREQAAAVIAPTVTVEVPKSGLRVSKAWVVKSVDEAVFYEALAHNCDLRGYVEIDNTRLVRVKAANPSMTVPGVVFEQIVR